MDELKIARSTADILGKLSRSCDGDTYDNGFGSDDPRTFTGSLRREELQLARLKAMAVELAVSRASETTRDLDSVMTEIELEIAFQLAKILAGTIDPVLQVLRYAAIEEDGEVCGVCQEEMGRGDDARAMGCMHKFHARCILQWLKRKNTCPLCRFEMQFNSEN